MAETYWPFDGIDTSETQFSQWARNIGDGVKGNPATTDLLVTANGSGMSVSLASGQAMVRGHYYYNNSGSTLAVTTANATNPRIDLVVLTLDPSVNTITASVLAGTPAATPVAPTLTQTDAANYQIALASVYVGAGVVSITQSNVTDLRTFLASNVVNPYTNYQVSGKNRLINGGFDIWQRGTTFNGVSTLAYTADRWQVSFDGSGATRNITQQAFTPGAAPVAGYESAYYLQFAQTVAGSGGTFNNFQQRIENVRTFAGQTITVSFWVNVAQSTAINVSAGQNFGTGGSSTVTTFAGTQTVSTTGVWTRLSYKIVVPSISGKTIGTANDALVIGISLPSNAVQTMSFWGMQAEVGSIATQFARSSATLAHELSACQRYYYRTVGIGSYDILAQGIATTTGFATVLFPLPTTMRTSPTSIDLPSLGSLRMTDGSTSTSMASASIALAAGSSIGTSSPTLGAIQVTLASAFTANRPYFFGGNNTVGAYVGFNAEM